MTHEMGNHLPCHGARRGVERSSVAGTQPCLCETMERPFPFPFPYLIRRCMEMHVNRVDPIQLSFNAATKVGEALSWL